MRRGLKERLLSLPETLFDASGNGVKKMAKEIPWDISNDLESLTTEVHLRLRSLDAVRSCFPSVP